MLGHKVFDLLQHLFVPLCEIQNILNVELVDDGASLLLLLRIPLRVFFLADGGILALFVIQQRHAVEG